MWTWRLERALFPPAKVAEVKHDWVPLERISRELQLAVIAAEDQRFADHNGFDMDAISSALKHNQQSRRVRGASTLSQQTAKNLFMWSDRSFLRKDRGLVHPADGAGLGQVPHPRGVPEHRGVRARHLWRRGRRQALLRQTGCSPDPLRGLLAGRRPAQSLALPGQAPSPYVQQRSAWIRRQMSQLGQVTLNRVHEAG